MSHHADRPVRTRFAPSPTGPLHIGGARSALFGWLLARHYDGCFILRIEDTDQKRFVPGSVERVMDGLRWLGITWDEGPDVGGDYGPYVQSERLGIYRKWADWLVEHDRAYPCYCTAERLQHLNRERRARGEGSGYDGFCRALTPDDRARNEAQGRPAVIRVKTPHAGETVVQDLIRGAISVDNSEVQDAILLKSDGFPTYHLAHIVDDHLMQISHVTRANEWLPSLPLHVLIWQAFGWETPYFAHLPVLLNPNGKGKLSKRQAGFSQAGKHVPVLVSEFQQADYLPEAVVNFLINIGWSFGDDREIFSVEEAIARFDITRVNPANSAYPIEKLTWLNGKYIREMSVERLAKHLRAPLEKAGFQVDDGRLLKIAPLVQPRLETFGDVVDFVAFVFCGDFKAPPADELIQKNMDASSTHAALKAAREGLAALETFDHAAQEAAMRALVGELGLKTGQLFGSLRAAVTGQRVSPPLFESMAVLGREETLRRIDMALEALTQAA